MTLWHCDIVFQNDRLWNENSTHPITVDGKITQIWIWWAGSEQMIIKLQHSTIFLAISYLILPPASSWKAKAAPFSEFPAKTAHHSAEWNMLSFFLNFSSSIPNDHLTFVQTRPTWPTYRADICHFECKCFSWVLTKTKRAQKVLYSVCNFTLSACNFALSFSLAVLSRGYFVVYLRTFWV